MKPITLDEIKPTSAPKTDFSGITQGHFQPLGFNKDESGVQAFYFFVTGCKSIIRLTASKFTKQNLMMLAPLSFWVLNFETKSSFDNLAAADWLITMCNQQGYFSDDMLRGRGAWIDNGRVIIHAGTHLLVNGKRYEFGEVDTQYIYELGNPLNLSTDDPLPARESTKLVNLIDRLNWGTEADGILLAGWLAISSICGILKWRPHLWITGAAGSGKSWVYNSIIRAIIKDIAISCQSSSTSSGIRQKLKLDAMNVAFDELEPTDEMAQERIKNVMELMRSASAEGGAPILKGSATGQSQSFMIRSCFAFVSIIPQISLDSDKRRISVMEISRHSDDSVFLQIEDELTRLLTDDYISRFHARILCNVKNILQSIKVFTNVISKRFHSRGLGDQLGTMLGGAWHLMHDHVVTLEEAEEHCKGIAKALNLVDKQRELSDEERCLQHILASEERVEGENVFTTKTVGEIIEIAAGRMGGGLLSSEANAKLKRLGMRVMHAADLEKTKLETDGGKYLAVLNTSPWIKAKLKGTAWNTSHSAVFARIPGAIKHTVRYSPGLGGRSILIPLNSVI